MSDTQDEAMYFSIGAHPAFVLDGHESLTGCRIGFAMDRYGVEAVNPDMKAEGISYRLLNAEGLLEDKEYKLDTEDGVMVTEGFFDRDAYIIENNQCHEVYLECDGERFVTVKFDAPVFGLWSPVGKMCRLYVSNHGTEELTGLIIQELLRNVNGETGLRREKYLNGVIQ